MFCEITFLIIGIYLLLIILHTHKNGFDIESLIYNIFLPLKIILQHNKTKLTKEQQIKIKEIEQKAYYDEMEKQAKNKGKQDAKNYYKVK